MRSQKWIVLARAIVLALLLLGGIYWWLTASVYPEHITDNVPNILGGASCIVLFTALLMRWDKQALGEGEEWRLTMKARERDGGRMFRPKPPRLLVSHTPSGRRKVIL